ncbi:hypothetical protein ACQP25_03280 [Microtetraspora malaysiensis]|uniref:hypothetical protein n=1 Tax=Microtetraspora malaysiensis TaxID=161358 RepID=UPI003D89BE8F
MRTIKDRFDALRWTDGLQNQRTNNPLVKLLNRRSPARCTSSRRRHKPKRLRLRLFAVAARLVRGGRRLRLRIAASWPWASQLVAAIAGLEALPAPT